MNLFTDIDNTLVRAFGSSDLAELDRLVCDVALAAADAEINEPDTALSSNLSELHHELVHLYELADRAEDLWDAIRGDVQYYIKNGAAR